MKLEDENYCFCCGERNPIGLHLKFHWEGADYVTEFTPKREHEGFRDVVHGGLLAAVLDEVMARMLWNMGKETVTAEMTVRLHKAARPGETVCFRGRLVKETGRLVECSAEARDKSGLVAEARGKFLPAHPTEGGGEQ
jgi:acyl-coenzyme A thioesterase PaaI-like protein